MLALTDEDQNDLGERHYVLGQISCVTCNPLENLTVKETLAVLYKLRILS